MIHKLFVEFVSKNMRFYVKSHKAKLIFYAISERILIQFFFVIPLDFRPEIYKEWLKCFYWVLFRIFDYFITFILKEYFLLFNCKKRKTKNLVKSTLTLQKLNYHFPAIFDKRFCSDKLRQFYGKFPSPYIHQTSKMSSNLFDQADTLLHPFKMKNKIVKTTVRSSLIFLAFPNA